MLKKWTAIDNWLRLSGRRSWKRSSACGNHKKHGTGTHMPLGCGRKCRLLSLLIGIAIATRDEHTKAMMNIGDHALGRGDVEAATSTHGHFAHVGSLLGPARHHGAHEVARLEPLVALVLLGAGARESVLVHAAHLSAAMPSRCDVPRNDVLDDDRRGRAPAYVGRIEPMGLAKPAHRAVVLRQA